MENLSKKDGGLAFPGKRVELVTAEDSDHKQYADVEHAGLSVLDYFAGQALAGACGSSAVLEAVRDSAERDEPGRYARRVVLRDRVGARRETEDAVRVNDVTKHYCDCCYVETPKTEIAAVDVIERPDWDGDRIVGGTTTAGYQFCRSCVEILRRCLASGPAAKTRTTRRRRSR